MKKVILLFKKFSFCKRLTLEKGLFGLALAGLVMMVGSVAGPLHAKAQTSHPIDSAGRSGQGESSQEEPLATTICPSTPQTTQAGYEDGNVVCVLDEDTQLDQTIFLPSSTILDCQGHTLSPKMLGSGSTVETYQASVPELAILLNGTISTMVRNCTLEGFDFGVMIIKSKIPEALADNPSALVLRQNKILSNKITARTAGVEVFGADNNEISFNIIHFTSGGGKGIHLHRDSDKNLVAGNTIEGSERPLEFARFLPGSDFEGGVGGSAVISSAPNFVLLNLIIDDTLVAQFPNVVGHRNNDNVIEENNISLPGPSEGKAHTGISIAAGTDGIVVRKNTVTGGRIGILGAGYVEHTPTTFPTTCTLDPARFCATTYDCFIPVVDTESKGICQGTRTVITDFRPPNVLVEDNTLTGPFNDAAIEMWNEINLIVQNNTINGTGSENGIVMGGEASKGGIVRRNIISGTRIGLVLTGSFAAPYGAQISLNDIILSTFRAIEVGSAVRHPAWAVPGAVELSAGHCAQDSSISCSYDKQCRDHGRGLCVNMRGNFWGRPCADSEGFREFRETEADSPKMSIVDGHPFGEPVLELNEEGVPVLKDPLPLTCEAQGF